MFMRWIFMVLLVLNGALPLWYFALGSGAPGQVHAARSTTYWPPPNHVADIVLLREQSASIGALEAGVSSETEAGGPRPALCSMVGPFPMPNTANYFIERLRALDVMATVRAFELPAGVDYWVYLAPEGSRQDAYRRLAELQAQGVDSHIILRGELAHGISLGIFGEKASAEAQVQAAQALGELAQIELRDRSYEEIWVVFGEGEAQKIAKSTWWQWLDHRKPFEERQNFCLDLASEENFL